MFEIRYLTNIHEEKGKNKFIQYTKDALEIMDELREKWQLYFDKNTL